ncbi:ATP-binding cassette domain-containing protein [Halomonas sp. BM-2019]|uniref:ATP-binding cassette domain-containing protein n=1 Tax=Halomonas sp. BM-2019 TaxID=2811227 RepID=UPI001B3C4531|nr:MAG: ATP-binding cassette domain-containing protein [Halomonas sp. BM-2019]
MIVEAEALGFRYGRQPVLQEVSFALASGHFHALLGPNGAGKSTLFGLMTRLLALQQGDLRLAGRSLRHQPAAVMRHLGVVFQHNALDLDLSVAQNLRYHAALHGLPPREARQRCQEELEWLGLAAHANRTVRRLNGGHRRRVEIARALLHRPSLLLLDEPTAGLDIDSREALNAHVRTLCRERRLTVLWATHLIEEIRPADHVLILHRGRLLADAQGDTLCRHHGGGSLTDTFHALTRETSP